jgi:ribosomal protein L17
MEMTMSEFGTKKVILKKPNGALFNSEVITIAPLDKLLADAMNIIGAELEVYRIKTGSGKALDVREAKAIQGYVDTLVKLSKEAREQMRSQDLAALTNEELLQLATELVTKNSGK